jgi:hypothetical protein
MAVYVDQPDKEAPNLKPYRPMLMCHMIADSRAELLAMADALGLKRAWIQNFGTHREHFDISKGKRAQAVRLGAIPLTNMELGHKLRERRQRPSAEYAPEASR